MRTIVTTKGTTLKARLFIRKDGKVLVYLPKSMLDNGYLAKAFTKDLTKGVILDATLNIEAKSLILEVKAEVKNLVVTKS